MANGFQETRQKAEGSKAEGKRIWLVSSLRRGWQSPPVGRLLRNKAGGRRQEAEGSKGREFSLFVPLIGGG
ncbi:MAG: hypothetical protein F6K14_19115 [Symploca sp. SIO2C1]|nr:hypothetical protein [Symploca sp. SIO2C1]